MHARNVSEKHFFLDFGGKKQKNPFLLKFKANNNALIINNLLSFWIYHANKKNFP